MTDEDTARQVAVCPQCKSESPPLFIDEEVTLKVNWFYLRCLASWAERYAADTKFKPESLATLGRILDSLRPLRPRGAPALTVRDEVAEAHRDHPDMDLTLVGDSTLKITPANKKATIH